MPRGPRLDAPGTLHHVMVRGIERRPIFRDERDRQDFLQRLAGLVASGAVRVYAWTLLANHAHLLLRTGPRPLARTMRCLLTGYAGAFNRRYRRVGHLFQNRYKSIVVEEDPYFLELTRYIHLNPLRAGLVRDLRDLDRFPWSGHATLLGRQDQPWQATAEILTRFSPTVRRARAQYRAFVEAGIAQGRRPDLQGGGLVRSLGGWAAIRTLRRGREVYRADERVLGSSEFVEALRHEVETAQKAAPRGLGLEALVRRVCRALGVPPEALQAGSREPTVCQARAGIAYLWVEAWRRSGRQLAPALGVRPQSVYRAVDRGRQERAKWDRLGK